MTRVETGHPGDSLDIQAVRADFPILTEVVRGKPLIYLDSAASSQKPRPVLEAIEKLYHHDYASIHRGVHALSERSTKLYETARDGVRRFLNAREREEIIFTRGTTEAINLVAQSFGRTKLEEGDEVLITELEHHSNIVPWQLLGEQVGIDLVVVPIGGDGDVTLEAIEKAITSRTRLIAVAHVSNALGTVLPVGRITELAHASGIPVLVDGAQAVPHTAVDVRALDADFYAFSSHKVYGPSGVGVLYGKRERLEAMPPYQGGGDMIKRVTFAETTYNDLPHRFEAGTPNIEGVIGLGAALDYFIGLGPERVEAHERDLLEYAFEALGAVEALTFIGTAPERMGLVSFTLDGIHPHDIGTLLDREGIAIRAGHHCAQPVMDHFGIPATVRASFGCYNTRDEIDALVAGLHRCREIFS